VSYRDWSEGDHREFNRETYERIFDEIPSVADLSENDLIRAEELFEAGWQTFGIYDEDSLYNIREEFFDLVGLYSDDFDWEAYRETYDSING
jgi:hypothetical protein